MSIFGYPIKEVVGGFFFHQKLDLYSHEVEKILKRPLRVALNIHKSPINIQSNLFLTLVSQV
jgi:hypothetical protein